MRRSFRAAARAGVLFSGSSASPTLSESINTASDVWWDTLTIGGRQRKLSEKRQKTAPQRKPLLLAGIVALAIVATVVAAILLSANPGEQQTGTTDRPYVGGHLHSMAVDPTDPEKVMIGGHDGAAMSNDGGEGWEQIPTLAGADPMGWVINPQDPSKMYAGGHPGFYHSEDGGKSWSQDNSGLPGTDVHGLGMDPQNPETLYAYIVNYGMYRSLDAGESWESVNPEMGTMGPILVDLRDSDTLYLALEDVFLKSDDGGKSWQQAGTIPGGMTTWVAQDRKKPDTFYAANGGVYKSTDGGESWQQVGDGLPEGVSVVEVAQSDPRVVYAGVLEGDTATVYRSEDRAESWEERN
jgi:photosystem II stability/assembly factor-like uncharacterized protein